MFVIVLEGEQLRVVTKGIGTLFTSGPVYPYHLDESISSLRGFRCIFSFFDCILPRIHLRK